MIALIDNDFVQKIAQIRRLTAEEKTNLVKKVFDAKDLEVHMHILVYNYEFVDINDAGKLFDRDIISILRWEYMFAGDDAKKAYYCLIVPELFKKLHGYTLEITTEGIFSNWISGSSLGEIHSLAACYVCGYGLFLSDDNDSKHLRDIIDVHYQKRIPVYNRHELIEQLEVGTLKKEEKRVFTHKK